MTPTPPQPTTATPQQPYFPTAKESRECAIPNREKRLTAELENIQALISRATYEGHLSVVFSGLLDDETKKTLTEKGYEIINLRPIWETPQTRILW